MKELRYFRAVADSTGSGPVNPEVAGSNPVEPAMKPARTAGLTDAPRFVFSVSGTRRRNALRRHQIARLLAPTLFDISLLDFFVTG